MHNNVLFLRKKPLPYQRGGDFINGHCIIIILKKEFGKFSWIINMKPYGHWKIVSYILCTLNLSNLLHLTIGSKLILT